MKSLRRVVTLAALTVLIVLPLNAQHRSLSDKRSHRVQASASTKSSPQIKSTLQSKRSPMSGYIENRGQIMDQNFKVNPEVLFLVSSPGLNIQLKENSVSYDTYWDDMSDVPPSPPLLYGRDTASTHPGHNHYMHRIDLRFVGAQSHPQITTSGKSEDELNFYNSATPLEGARHVHRYERVRYNNLYNNIDLEFFLDERGRPEYQFIVHPGGNPDDIRIGYNGALSTQLRGGRIKIQLANGYMTEHIPASFDALTSKKVRVRYAMSATNEFVFRCGKYDTSHDLVIDPMPYRIWGTYFGGDTAETEVNVCVDNSSNAYITGYTNSSTKIASTGAYQQFIANFTTSDIYIAKFNPNGGRVWSTYYGGTGYDDAADICFDGSDNILVVGHAESAGMSTPGAHQTSPTGGLLAKFSSDGFRVWATYYGLSGDWLTAVAVDGNGNILVGGRSLSGTSTLHFTAGAYQTVNNSAYDCIIAKFNSGGQRMWGSYYGGTGAEYLSDIVADQSNNVVFCGYTTSTNFISSPGSHQPAYGSLNSAEDGMLVKLSADGSTRLWGTYYGGTLKDMAMNVAVDQSNNIYMCGQTQSTAAIGTSGAYKQNFIGGIYDCFLAKFSSAGVRQWGTYFGGSQGDICFNGLCIDSKNNALVYATTGSSDFIATADAYQAAPAGNDEAFLMKFSPTGSRLWGTYYGGAIDELAYGIAADGLSGVTIAGTTHSRSGIATSGSYQPNFNGNAWPDAYVVHFWDCVPPTPTLESAGNPTLCLGDVERYTVTPTVPTNTISWITPTLGSFVGPTNGNSLLIRWTSLGRDTVRVKETDPTTGCYTITDFKVQIFKGPTASSTASVSICKGASVNLDAAVKDGTGPFVYTWTPTDSLSSSSILNPVAHPSATTTYTLQVSDSHGCQSTTAVIVNVFDRPVANAGKTQSVCPGQSVTLGSPAQRNCTYQWSPYAPLNNSTAAQPRATITTPTTFQCVVTNDSTHCSDTATVLVRLKSVSVATTPDQPDFGTLGACEGSRDTVITINNTGSDSITVISQNSTSPAFSFSDALPLGIGAGQSRSVHIRFSPTTQGQATGTIHLLVLPCSTDIAINLRGSKSDLALSASRSVVDYGTSLMCSGAVQRDSVVRLKNNGSSDMTLQAPIITAPFSIVSPQFPQVIKPGASLDITVRYQPSTTGNYSTSMRVPFSWSGCKDTVLTSLFARDIQPSMTLNTQNMTFRELLGCDAPRDSVIEITNTSELDMTLDSASMSNKDFTVRSTLPITIAAHQSVQIQVQFNPAGNGTSNGTLTLLARPCDVRATVQLSGSKQGVSLSAPDTVDLGTLALCSGGDLRSTFRLTNTSSGALGLRLNAQTITDDFSTDIVIGDSIASGASRDYSIRFSPIQHTTDGVVVGELRLTMEPCALTKIVNFKARLTSMKLSADTLLDFGSIASGQVVQKQLNIINTGSADVIIDQVPDAQSPFKRESTTHTLPDTLKSGDTLGVIYSFTAPSDFGVSVLEIPLSITKPCAASQSVMLKGNTSTRPDTLLSTIAVQSIEGTLGDMRNVVVRVRREQSSGTQSRPTDFKLTLEYNPNILFLLNDQQKCQITADNRCELQFSGQRSVSDTLLVLPARITLGNTDFDAIKLTAFSWTNATVANKIELEDGSIHVLNGCEQGGIRFYRPTSTATSLGARPNPVSSVLSIEIGLAEPSNASLDLVDVSGQSQMNILTNTALQAGRHIISQDVSALSNGSYFLRLRTANYTLVSRVDVLH